MRSNASYQAVDILGPTPERAEIANGYLVPRPIWDSPNSANRVSIGTGYWVASPIFKMHQDGRISDEEQKAARFFHFDYTVGMMSPCVIAKYGERMGSGGTPLNQQANTERLTPEERRAHHHNRYIRACEWINHKPTSYWLTIVACEVPIGEPAKVPTLEDVGRSYAGYSNRPQATAAGATVIIGGLQRLVDFYGVS